MKTFLHFSLCPLQNKPIERFPKTQSILEPRKLLMRHSSTLLCFPIVPLQTVRLHSVTPPPPLPLLSEMSYYLSHQPEWRVRGAKRLCGVIYLLLPSSAFPPFLSIPSLFKPFECRMRKTFQLSTVIFFRNKTHYNMNA